MVLVSFALLAVVVVAIAGWVVARESGRLAAQPPAATFDLEAAVAWVADHLPFEAAARLTHDDVRDLLRWHLEYLRQQAVRGNGTAAPVVPETVVVADREVLDHLLARATTAGADYGVLEIEAVLDAERGYLERIGAIRRAPGDGPPAAGS